VAVVFTSSATRTFPVTSAATTTTTTTSAATSVGNKFNWIGKKWMERKIRGEIHAFLEEMITLLAGRIVGTFVFSTFPRTGCTSTTSLIILAAP